MTQNYPKISIITPNFNGESYLEATIQSVVSQNYPNLEYILMDGSSSDSSVQIIKKHEQKISIWKSEKDAGQADAINKGIQICSGEWIAFLNSDDLYSTNALSQVAKFIQNHPNERWLVGKTEIFGNNGEIFRTRELEFKPENKPQDWISYGVTSPQPSTFLHRSLVEKVGLFNAEFHFSFDCDYWLRAHLCGFTPTPIPEVLARFRFHDSSKTASSRIPFLAEHRKMLANPDLKLSSLEAKIITQKLNKLEAESIVSQALHTKNPKSELVKALKINSGILSNRMFWGALRRSL